MNYRINKIRSLLFLKLLAVLSACGLVSQVENSYGLGQGEARTTGVNSSTSAPSAGSVY